MRKIVSLLAAPAAALLLLGNASVSPTVKLEKSGQAVVKAIAPSFGGWDLEGKAVLTLDGLRTKPSPAPLLVTFGASWCSACRSGLPRLKAIAGRHPALRLVLIDVEPEQDKAQAFAREMGIEGPALHDKFENIARTYGCNADGKLALPRTFLIAANGRVQAIYREEGPDLERVIDKDLAELSAQPKSGAKGR